MRYLFRLAPLITVALLGALPLQPTGAEPTEGVLTVAARHAPPFAIKQENGSWEGISISLWQQIANAFDWEYRFQEMGLEQMLKAVALGEADAAVAALTIY